MKCEETPINETKTAIASLCEAHANNKLSGYRVLELKGSHDDQSTCNMQWGPQMRT